MLDDFSENATYGATLHHVNIFRYLLIVVVAKYSLVKIQDGGNRKWKWSKSGSLSLLTAMPPMG